MARVTGIQWTDTTANIWIGCTAVSAGCDFCYAEDLFGTEGSRLQQVVWGPHGERKPVKAGLKDIAMYQRRAAKNGGIDPELGRRRRIFINSLSDAFDNHKSIGNRRDMLWDAIRASPDLDFQLVTKRAQNIPSMLPEFWDEICGRIWLLVSTENQVEFDRRWGVIEGIFAFSDDESGIPRPAVVGISAEPLLEMIIVTGASVMPEWIIAGGESGKNARDVDEFAFVDLRAQIRRRSTAYYQKQMPHKAPVPSYLLTREFPA